MNPDHMKFLCSVNDNAYEEMLSYNEIFHHIEKDNNTDIIWQRPGSRSASLTRNCADPWRQTAGAGRACELGDLRQAL